MVELGRFFYKEVGQRPKSGRDAEDRGSTRRTDSIEPEKMRFIFESMMTE
jgi:hypothetical protein